MKGGYYGLRGKQISLILIALICTTIFIWAWDKSPLLTTFIPPQNRLLIPSPEMPTGAPEVGITSPKPDSSVKERISYAVQEGGLQTEQEEKGSNDVKTINSATKSTPETDVSLKDNISNAVPEGETRSSQAEKSLDVVTQTDSSQKGPHETNMNDGNKIGSSTEKKEEEKDTADQKTSHDVTPTASHHHQNIDDVNEITSSNEKKEGESKTEQAESSYDVVTPIGSDTKSTTQKGIDDGHKITSSIEKKDIAMVVQQIETKPTQDLLEDTRPDLAEKIPDIVAPESSSNQTASEEKKEVLQSESIPEKDSEEENLPDRAKRNFGAVTPVSPANKASSEEGKDDNSVAADVKKKEACNYAKGKWEEDSSRPLYSGFGCKKWLSEMWACRLTQRTDFAYESFRWKPFNCEMPEFDGDSFLKRMKDKTIALVGDSLGRQQFQSLMCMVTGGKERPDVVNVGWEYGLVKARGATRPDGWAYRFPSTNTTILYYWSASLCDLEPINPNDKATNWAMHLDRPPAFLRRYLDRFDVLVLNTGHHWNRGKLNANRWVMHVGGVPNTDRKLAEIGRAKNFTIYSIVNWVNLQLPKHPRLKAFFRTISPRHFFNGDWNTGGSCDNTSPLAGGKEVTQDESLDHSASGAVAGTNVKLLDITAISQLRDEGHISRYSIRATPGVQDCLHWCLPGIPDTWNELMIAQL